MRARQNNPITSLARIVLTTVLLALVATGCSVFSPSSYYTNLVPPEGVTLEEGVFPLEYIGVDTDEYSVHSWTGLGRATEPTTDFTKSLNLSPGKTLYGHHPLASLPGDGEAAVEYDDGEAVALYLDLNANSRLDAGERIEPLREGLMVKAVYSDKSSRTLFLTPDIQVTNKEGVTAPARLFVETRSNMPDALFSIAAMHRSWGLLNGKPHRLTLFNDGIYNATVNDFGSSSYSLFEAGGRAQRRSELSSLILFDKKFYSLRFSDDGRQVFIEKGKTPLGTLKIDTTMKSDGSAQCSQLFLFGAEDPKVYFSVSPSNNKSPDLPALNYTVRGSLYYGPKEAETAWRNTFYADSAAQVEPDKTTTLNLGDPKMTVEAAECTKEEENPVPRTTFSKGKVIHILSKCKGKSGERYYGFSNSSGVMALIPSGQIQPETRILDSGGNLVTKLIMDYG